MWRRLHKARWILRRRIAGATHRSLVGVFALAATSAAVGTAAHIPPTKQPTVLRLLNDEHKLVDRATFDQFCSNTKEMIVVTAIGTYGSGKSTLLNEVFFEGAHAFQPHQRVMQAKGQTQGLHAALTTWTIPNPTKFRMDADVSETIQQPVLVIDSEGLFAAGKGSLLTSSSMAMRTLAISDLLLVNTFGPPDTNNIKSLAEARENLSTHFPDLNPAATSRPSAAIIFSQRLPLPLDLVHPAALFGGVKIPPHFETPSVVQSSDHAVVKAQGPRLELGDLKAAITANCARLGTSPKTPATLWDILSHMDEVIPEKKVLVDLETTATSVTRCSTLCEHCNAQCRSVSYLKHKKHSNETVNCKNNSSRFWYCRKCGDNSPTKKEFAVSWWPGRWSIFYWRNGLFASCKKHGDLHYHDNSDAFTAAVAIHQEHQFPST